MLNKKAGIDILSILTIIIVLTVVLMCFIIIFVQKSNLEINEKKINSQFVLNNFFYSNCFSKNFSTIEQKKFNQENINNCFKNFNKNILFRTKIEDKTNFIYFGEKNLFLQKASFCQDNSNLECFTITYPINFISNKDIYSYQKLVIEVII